MKSSLFIAVLASSLSVLLPTGKVLHAQTARPEGPHAASEIVTTGTGEAVLTPDRAKLRVGVETHASTAEEAASRNAAKSKAVVEKLKSLGYAVDSLRTVGFGVNPNYSYDDGRRLIDYQAVATIMVTVSRLEQLGTTIDAVLAAGATDVSNIVFESDDMRSGRAAALARALDEARADADALARAGGGRLGRLLEANTQPGGYPIPMADMAMRASNTALPPQDVVVSLMVQARWEFVPGGN
jgi:uncharacterized protein YggE